MRDTYPREGWYLILAPRDRGDLLSATRAPLSEADRGLRSPAAALEAAATRTGRGSPSSPSPSLRSKMGGRSWSTTLISFPNNLA
jgi:hypothetical protein